MGGKTSKEVQLKATQNYMSKMHTYKLIVPKDKAQEYKEYADQLGMSMNKFIITCIEEKIKNNK